MKRAISYSIDTVEELERVEQEEAKVIVVEASSAPPLSLTTLPLLGNDFIPL
jgi:hypothetical protein